MPMDWQVKAPISAMKKKISFKIVALKLARKVNLGSTIKNSHTIISFYEVFVLDFFVGFQTSFSCL